jgi:16S rRNA (uracil1498-N3)-methyltransferase
MSLHIKSSYDFIRGFEMRRFFWDDRAEIGETGIIHGNDARHIRTVLRMKPGDSLAVFDGAGNDFEAEIKDISSDEVRILPVKKIHTRTDSPVSITFAQALLKGKKMDVLARQITELGIAKWVPFLSDRSVPVPAKGKLPARLERWQTIVIESLKQCRRSRLTEINDIVSFDQTLEMGRSDDVKLIFWENETRALQEVLDPMPDKSKKIFAILGPEGGFSEAEIEKAVSLGYQSVSLGPRILKAETAALSVCTLMQYLFGDLGGR